MVCAGAVRHRRDLGGARHPVTRARSSRKHVIPTAAAVWAPDRAPPEPVPGTCLPAEATSWRRKSSAISRSMPGHSCRPAAYSFSKPWLVNFSVRLFSVTVRTT